MQSRQFDNLMDNKPSKWVKGLNNNIDTINVGMIRKQSIENFFKKNEEEVSEENNKEIQSFITMLNGIKPKIPQYEIRRRVKVKFNIVVV